MVSVFFYYALWHYTRAPGDIIQIWKNFLWFFYNLFSIPLLLLTLFSPWQKLDEPYKRTFDLEAIGGTIIVNLLMRLVGFVVRLGTILFGTIVLLATLIGGALFFISWLIAPILLSLMFLSGVLFLFL